MNYLRQADNTIKGYLYQFNKSLLEILKADDDSQITVEGVIEDIDIEYNTHHARTIQCKYHEEEKYLISSVAVPITEMVCHFCESTALGVDVDYILYAYYKDNVTEVDVDEYIAFIEKTKNKEILTKFFHRIYEINDSNILDIANKVRKTETEKKRLTDYYSNNREILKLKVDIRQFWNHFEYVKAEQFEILKESVITEFQKTVDEDTARSLYYPNALAYIAELSSNADISQRKINRNEFFEYLSNVKSVMITRWNLEIFDIKTTLTNKKRHLTGMLRGNPEIRAIVFSKKFVDKNKDNVFVFMQQYIDKYYKKVKLQNPPIFIFEENDDIMNGIIISLLKYQKHVNTGQVGGIFVENSFVYNSDCATDFVCKIAKLSDMSDDILEKCNVNQLFWIGTLPIKFNSTLFEKEVLDILDMHNLRYLFGLENTLEVK